MSEAEVKAPKAKKEPKVAVEKIIQNGVTRPKEGTQTGRVWEISEAMSNALGAPVKRAEVIKAAEAEGINPSTTATQYGKWRKFHGLVAVKEAANEAEAEAA